MEAKEINPDSHTVTKDDIDSIENRAIVKALEIVKGNVEALFMDIMPDSKKIEFHRVRDYLDQEIAKHKGATK